ncbi:tRNA (adenosine(37)-N6)-threonylcarbamoyltransferase complex dimerization subunit type 1 [Candidatus Phytoplasma luffae]|uniref:tRNA (Adenosine(37)-N6)-threonylcarbamoyltransferase complex dimerization subunit type 1 n=1 Tax=Loofah witches'-broom phytoplasma TaxID=35773 RepID=A0A975ILT8_LOWBP|nr:tRNA (adenosine(37)-N6)-threonylcarbamoyltransferase complex dimerization subunit type 1 TsaB [Candidatus Phytoplasma luffae]QTX02705.1 tRNA (adenosine(37)-N6)-threonylcarbamoyltransferase complex dimerization subunit type 1 [Candidatus Phytoplasma luffae]
MNSFIEPKYIILDVSTDLQLIILSTNNKIIDIKKSVDKQNFVSGINSLIHQILNQNNLGLKDLSGVIVGIGPGSYIGSRLAVLTAKFLSLELSIPLFQISSLLLLSSGFSENIITPKIYAKKNFFYSLSLEDDKIVLEENIYENVFLNKFLNHFWLKADNFHLSISKIFRYMKKVDNIELLMPNYYIHY